MKQTLRSSLLMLSFFMAPLAQAKPPAPAPPEPVEVTLAGGGFSKPIGVEPEGGRFERVLPERAKAGNKGEAVLLKVTPTQSRGTLAIYASDTPTLHEERPLARLEVSGLDHGPGRVGVRFTVLDSHKISVETWEVPSLRPLKVRQLSEKELQLAKYAPAAAPMKRAEKPNLPGIGSRDNGVSIPERVSAPNTLAQSIGVRAAGGLVQPLLSAGAAPGTTKTYFMRPRSADQTTADVSFFTGNSPYIENDKLWARYLISGIPTGPNRRLKLDFIVGADGKVGMPKAIEVTSKQDLKIQKYSESAADRLKEPARESAPLTNGRIPAAPAGGG